ncbi:hypothetical protein CRUP_000052 [Coryphaenoides rupestris]|nr:hypothetical protein CRUP_000052 [Coryphaenoides rupestris]
MRPWRTCGIFGLLPVLVVISAAFYGPLSASDEVWGYVDVRDGAHMFWWLYYADSPAAAHQHLPLVMWLQGGPGGSGTGFGNFEEIGPLDRDQQPRKTSWVQSASVLFVDNPVGTGFSYVDKSDGYAKDVATVASDMLVLLRSFFTERKEFQNVPFYIFSESYGGKMAAAISLELTKAVAQGSVKCQFAGVALGDSWISPIGRPPKVPCVVQSLLDDYGLTEVSNAAEAVRKAVEQEQFQKATVLWSVTESVIEQNTNGVNFYNILTKEPDEERSSLAGDDFLSLLSRRHVRPLHRQSLVQLMNGPIRKKLGVIPHNVTWGGQELWVNRLDWVGLPTYKSLRWTALDDPASPGTTGAFYKSYKNFCFYWILKAGHMIPSDQGAMALKMLKMVTQQA